MNLFEAFDKLKNLDEDVFGVDKKDLQELEEFIDTDDTADIVDIYEADDSEKQNHSDDVVLDCSVCHSKLYKNKNDVKLDEEVDLANVGDECPYCHSTDGFSIVGEIDECGIMYEDLSNIYTYKDKTIVHNPDTDKFSIKGQDGEFETSADAENAIDGLNESLTESSDDGEGPLVYESTLTDKMGNEGVIEVRKPSSDEDKILYYAALYYRYDTIRMQAKDQWFLDYLKRCERNHTDLGEFLDNVLDYVVFQDKRDAVELTDRLMNESLLESLDETFYSDAYAQEEEDIEHLFDKKNRMSLPYYLSDLYDILANNQHVCKDDLDDIDEIMDKYAKDTDDYTYETFRRMPEDVLTDIMGIMERSLREHYSSINRDWYTNESFNKKSNSLRESHIKKRKLMKAIYEALEDVQVNTDEQRIVVSSDENGKVTVITEPKGVTEEDSVEEETEENAAEDVEEVIKPVSPETEAELTGEEVASEEEGETDSDEESTEDEEDTYFDEESFDEVAESYLKKINEQVASYKTKSVLRNRSGDKYIIEGVVKFNNKSHKPTKFVLENKEISNSKLMLMNESVKFFVSKKNNKLITEGMVGR